MNLDLQDKVVVITGPAKGMGRAVTLAFAREGARLVLAGRDLDAIAPVAREVTELGSEVEVVPCDMTRSADAEALAAAALDCFGRIDVLVNVAGGSGPIGKTGWDTTQSEFDEIVQLNMTGCFNTMRAVMPAMIEQGSGKIVNVGGTFGMRGRAGRMAYSASKWGLRGITKSFALEAGPHGINVNCVAPGMVDGPRFRDKVCANMAKTLGISPEEAATPTPPTTRSSASPPTRTLPMPACFSAATSPARSPASTSRSMAAGPCFRST
ncbi:SDR family NAD(P)-dependent oxidoreductase [Halopseudomonas pachastrellae]|nr:SDR family NAD(P)-dependent oxidoreductase [Halopseudomonas pachastrellae]